MASAKKTDNGDPEAKILVRRQALEWAPEKPAVLECFAGRGHMYREVWAKACGRHLGMDVRFHRGGGDSSGECWRGNNELLLKRAMQVAEWDVIDLDSYANPWPLLRRVLKLAVARPLVVTATCTIERALQQGSSDFGCAVAGYPFAYSGALARWYDDIIRWALAWCQSGAILQAASCRRIHARTMPGQPGHTTTTYYVLRYQPR